MMDYIKLLLFFGAINGALIYLLLLMKSRISEGAQVVLFVLITTTGYLWFLYLAYGSLNSLTMFQEVGTFVAYLFVTLVSCSFMISAAGMYKHFRS